MAAITQIYRHRLTKSPGELSKWKFNSGMKRLFPVSECGIEVLSAVVKNEVNKAGTLEMDVILNDDDLLIPYRDFISVSDAYKTGASLITRDILFFGRVISITCDATLTSHVTCEGYLACLSDCPMTSHDKANPFKFGKGTSLQRQYNIAAQTYSDLLRRKDISWRCNFARSTDEPDAEVSISYGTSCGDFIVNTLVTTYGGVVRLEYSNNSIPFGTEKLGLVWQDGPDENPNYYNSNGEIKWKVNMLDASYETTQDELFTAVMPWFDDYEDKKQSHYSVEQGGTSYPTYYMKTSMVEKYGLIIKSVSFKDCKNAGQLAKKAKRWLNRNCVDYGSQYTFKAVDLHYLDTYDTDGVKYFPSESKLHTVNHDTNPSETIKGKTQEQHTTISNNVYAYTKRIHVLDKVAVTYPAFMKYIDSKNKREKMICISAEYDIINPENDTFVIGAVVPPDLSDIKFVSNSHSGSGYGGGHGGR